MIGRIIAHIHYEVLGDGLKMHVRHEAPDGLWDSKDWTVSNHDEQVALDGLLARLPDEIREVLRMTEERTA